MAGIKIKSTDELVARVKILQDRGRGIIKRKNHDYGDHANNDPFVNLRRHGVIGFLVRMEDKLSRLNTLSASGRERWVDESFTDTAIDLMNYAAMLVCFVEDSMSHDTIGDHPVIAKPQG